MQVSTNTQQLETHLCFTEISVAELILPNIFRSGGRRSREVSAISKVNAFPKYSETPCQHLSRPLRTPV